MIDEDTGMMEEMVEIKEKVGQFEDITKEILEGLEDKLPIIEGPSLATYNKAFLIDTVLETLTDVNNKDQLKTFY